MSSFDFGKTGSILGSDVVDNDVHVKLQELTNKLIDIEKEKQQVEKEKQEMHDSYNAQRAKYQKLYMQKEAEVKRLQDELGDLRTQLSVAEANAYKAKEDKLNAQAAQISELNQIVQETVEESSLSQNQVKTLQQAISKLEDQLAKVTAEKGDRLLLAPSNMLSATKSFAKKVVSQLGSDLDKTLVEEIDKIVPDDLEDSMRKAKKDAEVIRSLVVPLETKIDELQEKLLLSEERLRKYEDGNRHQKRLLESSAHSSVDSVGKDGAEGVSPSRSLGCDMCANYEAQLQTQQQLTTRLQKQKDTIESNLERFKEDLAKETQFRIEMEEKWNEKKEEQKLQVSQLKAELVAGKTEIQELRDVFESTRCTVIEELKLLTFDREKISAEMQALQQQNDSLVGKHSKHSAELRDEAINFPDNVEDLQLLLLGFHEDLIAAKVAKEAKEDEEETLKLEVQLLHSQLENLTTENTTFRNKLEITSKESIKLKTELENLLKEEIRYKAVIDNLKDKLRQVTEESNRNSEAVSLLRGSVSFLQGQLDRNEEVQKDFVRLSQSLQVDLEKIRAAENEVRWQHEDDINDCQGCKQLFSSAKKKAHCRHCGKIFCPSCLNHKVLSGPKQRPSPVCQLCHTLLSTEAPPYFSQEPPHSPH